MQIYEFFWAVALNLEKEEELMNGHPCGIRDYETKWAVKYSGQFTNSSQGITSALNLT